MSYTIPSDIEQRDDTRAIHIRNCHRIAKECASMAGSTSGWGGPGEAAFDHLQDVSRMMQMEVAIRLVEDKLLDMGYDDQDGHYTNDDLYSGEYRIRSVRDYWIIEVKHDPNIHDRSELMLALCPLLDGWSGADENWEDGFIDAGPVWVK